MLRRAGATVAEADNGYQAMTILEDESFELILLDIQIPVMDGYTAARKMRDKGLKLPIIALTAHAMKGDDRKCFDAGCSAYLAKPIDPTDLLLAVGDAMGLHGAEESQEDDTADADAAPTDGDYGQPLISALPTDDEDFREIVIEFVDRLKQKLDAMSHAWEQEDMDQLAQEAHWLKGAGGTAGFHAFTDPARDLEQAAKEHQAQDIEDHIRGLRQIAGRIVIDHQRTGETSA